MKANSQLRLPLEQLEVKQRKHQAKRNATSQHGVPQEIIIVIRYPKNKRRDKRRDTKERQEQEPRTTRYRTRSQRETPRRAR